MSAPAAARPLVSVFGTDATVKSQVAMPVVLTAPIRPDIVHFVHSQIAKNTRQPYSVSEKAGHQTSAISWGTGRAVSRIPRVPGGGTSRAGQGAFGNMCRKGRMFAPTKIWRKWHGHVNVNQRRYAIVSALAASALPALVMARGHRVDAVPEMPLVIDAGSAVERTKDAVAMLARFGATADVEKSADSKKIRAGKGKMRNRRYVMRRGPLVIYASEESTGALARSFRNIAGVELARVESLNLLQLAPGGHLGRFCVWTSAAFAKLDALFGTYTAKATLKAGYALPRHLLSNADIARVINSDELQSVVRPAIAHTRRLPRHKNALRNHAVMDALNPHAAVVRAREEGKRGKAVATAKAANKAQRSNKKQRQALRVRGQAFFHKISEEGELAL